MGETLSAGAAMLRITSPSLGTYDFLMPEEFSPYGHKAEYRYAQMIRSSASYPRWARWSKGKDDPVSLELTLVVGASHQIDTPGKLMSVVTRLAGLVLPSTGTKAPQGRPELIRLQIGTWFARTAVVESTSTKFRRPYHPDSGLPYVADITLGLQYVYDQLPNVKSFSFYRG